MSTDNDRLEMATSEDGVLVLAGEIDAATAPELAERLADPGVAAVDMAGVTFIDSIGLRALLQARARHGAALTLRSLSPAVRRLFEVTGLSGYLDIKP